MPRKPDKDQLLPVDTLVSDHPAGETKILNITSPGDPDEEALPEVHELSDSVLDDLDGQQAPEADTRISALSSFELEGDALEELEPSCSGPQEQTAPEAELPLDLRDSALLEIEGLSENRSDATVVDHAVGQTAVVDGGGLSTDARAWKARVQQLERELEGEPDAAQKLELLLEIGAIYADELQLLPAAEHYYRQALVLDPADDRAFSELEALFQEQGEQEKLAALLIDHLEQLTDEGDQAALLGRVAELYERLGQRDRAVITLEAALGLSPTDRSLARRLRQLQEPERTTSQLDEVEILEQQLQQLGDDAARLEVYERLAGLYDRRSDSRQVVRCLEEMLILAPRRLPLYRKLEQLHQREGALEALAEVIWRHLEVADVEERVELGLRLGRLYEGQLPSPRQAIDAYEEVLAAEQGHLQALQALVRLHQAQQDWEAVADALEGLIVAAGPGASPELEHQLGMVCLEQLDDVQAAEASFLRVLEKAPGHVASLRQLGAIYSARKDYGKAVKLLLQGAQATANPVARARLLHKAGTIALHDLEDEDRALTLLGSALEADPDHLPAAAPLGEILWRRKDYERLQPVLELELRKGEGQDPGRRALICGRLGEVCRVLGKPERAARFLGEALELDPRDLAARRGLADLAFEKERFAEAYQRYRELLPQLDELQRPQQLELLERLAESARQQGELQEAARALERLLQLNPRHRPAVEALAKVQADAGNWQAALEAKLALLEGGEAQEPELYQEVGRILFQQLHQLERAEQVYRQGLQLQPDHHGLLHDLIELTSQAKNWPETIWACERMAELEPKPELRAKYYQTIALIYRDSLDDPEQAIAYLNQVLDEDPSQLQAFEIIDKICTSRRAWKQLDKNYRKMIHRLPAEGMQELKLMLWHNLGEVLRSRRRDFEGAIAAFEVAASLDPDNLDRLTMLAELYQVCGQPYLDKAIAIHHQLLQRSPLAPDLHQTLRKLYLGQHRYDRAWCLSAVQRFLGANDPEAEEIYQRWRPEYPGRAQASVSDDLWHQHLCHPDQHRALNALFATVTPVLAAVTARPPASYGLKARETPEARKQREPWERLFEYCGSVLGVSRVELQLRSEQPAALLLAHTPGIPTLVLGARLLQAGSERERLYLIGRQLALLRPEHFLRCVFSSPGQLQGVLLATLALFQPQLPLPREQLKAIEPLLEGLRRNLQPLQLEQLGRLVRQLPLQDPKLVERWWTATELTADRASLLLCDNLRLAAELIRLEPESSVVPANERVRQLIGFACSESYFALRVRTGMAIG